MKPFYFMVAEQFQLEARKTVEELGFRIINETEFKLRTKGVAKDADYSTFIDTPTCAELIREGFITYKILRFPEISKSEIDEVKKQLLEYQDTHLTT